MRCPLACEELCLRNVPSIAWFRRSAPPNYLSAVSARTDWRAICQRDDICTSRVRGPPHALHVQNQWTWPLPFRRAEREIGSKPGRPFAAYATIWLGTGRDLSRRGGTEVGTALIT